MGNLERRVGGLEARKRSLRSSTGQPKKVRRDEERVERDWLLRAEMRRNEALGERARHVRDLLKLFNTQNLLARMSMDETVNRILAWGTSIEGITRSFVEREVALAIYRQQQGTENMVCPQEWRESFVAGDAIRDRFLSAPDEEMADVLRRLKQERDAGEDDPAAHLGARFGITQEHEKRAIGPDHDEITVEERGRRIVEYLADVIYGEKCYRVGKLVSSWRSTRERGAGRR